MASYSIRFKASVRKDLRPIPNTNAARILERIEALAEEPRPSGCDKLGAQERYRVRQGAFRIGYEVFDHEWIVHVVKVGHRRAACPIRRGALPRSAASSDRAHQKAASNDSARTATPPRAGCERREGKA